MTAIDLTEAVEAAARATWERGLHPHSLRWGGATETAWEDLSPFVRYQFREYVLPIVVAAAPAIEGATIAAHGDKS